MIITEVNDKKSRKEFLLLPLRLYKDDPNYIAPLDNDIESIFDPKKIIFTLMVFAAGGF